MKEVNMRLLLEALGETRCGDQVDGRGMMKGDEGEGKMMGLMHRRSSVPPRHFR